MYQKVLVTGGNGLLGTKTVELLLAAGREPVSVSLEPEVLNRHLGDFPYHQLDISNAEAVSDLFRQGRPDAVIHTAAVTAVDACETQRELAWTVNVTGTANVARACAEVGARMVHISTEYVFDGAAGPYTEEDVPSPQGYYALTKYESEKAAQANCSDLVLARTTVLYGEAPNVRPTFIAWLVGKLEKGEPVRIVDDQIGSPTLADNMAQMLLALLDSGETGIFNTVGDTIIDRFSFSVMAAKLFGLNPELISPTKTSELNQPAPRPLKAGLVMDKFKARFPQVPVLTAEQSLQQIRSQMGR